MNTDSTGRQQSDRFLNRPYRSHIRPACIPCRRRKSRCKIESSSAKCVICMVHETSCVFPRSQDRIRSNSARISPLPSNEVSQDMLPQTQLPFQQDPPSFSHPACDATGANEAKGQNASLKAMTADDMGIFVETRDDASHILSPATADDNHALDKYLSTVQEATSRRIVGTMPAFGGGNRVAQPVLFRKVPRRPLGVSRHQSLASQKCEIIEKLVDPDVEILIKLYVSALRLLHFLEHCRKKLICSDRFFRKMNTAFPVFDRSWFLKFYAERKERLSPALLANLYASALIFWKDSPELSTARSPDIRFVWVQANEALNSELFLSPGMSSIIAIILNVCGRPSTAIFGNGGIFGTAVALSNALGLNRDPSEWNITQAEKNFRIRIWWLLVILDRW